MSFTMAIVKTVTGSLKLAASRINSRQGVKLCEPGNAVLQNPRFTKDQLENLKAQAGSTKYPAS